MKDNIWMTCFTINLLIALLHIYIIFKGAEAYRFFGAGEWMATKSEQGSWIPSLITFGVTAVFLSFSAYNLVGANVISLPLAPYALAGITLIYLIRGSIVFTMPFADSEISLFNVVSSSTAFLIGLLHLAGMYFLVYGKATA